MRHHHRVNMGCGFQFSIVESFACVGKGGVEEGVCFLFGLSFTSLLSRKYKGCVNLPQGLAR